MQATSRYNPNRANVDDSLCRRTLLNKSPKPPLIFSCTVINELLNEEEIEKEAGKREKKEGLGKVSLKSLEMQELQD